jgi:flagellar biosynthesis chaperone FliJ
MQKFRLKVKEVVMSSEEYNDNLDHIDSLEERIDKASETIKSVELFIQKLQDSGINFQGELKNFFLKEARLSIQNDGMIDGITIRARV